MKKLLKWWPGVFILGVWIILFFPFFSKGLIPMPADIITGVYYPWLDYKWGFSTGVPVKNPLLSDIPSLLYPWRSFVIDQLKNGQWPLWNPYYFAGMPLLANFQSAVFSYVNIFFVFFSKPIAWSLGVITSPLLTLIFLYSFLRLKKLKIIPSLFGAIVFALSGFQLSWMEYNVHGHTVVFFLLILISLEKYLSEKKFFWLLLTPVFVALQIFSGYLPLVIYGMIVIGFYVVFFYLIPEVRTKKIALKKYLVIAFFLVFGLLMSGVQLIPGFELANSSIRLIDPSTTSTNASFLPIKNLVTAIAPDFFGNPATRNYFGVGYYDNFNFFAGTSVIVIIFYLLFLRKRNKDILFWLGCLIFSLILAIENPLGNILEKLFFLSGGVAARSIFITDFSLAMLGALGLQKIITENIDKRALALSSILSIAMSIYLYKLSSLFGAAEKIITQRNLVIPFFVLFSSIFLICIYNLKFIKRFKNFLLFLFVIITSGQLLYSANKYLPFSKKDLLFPKTPVLDFLINEKNKSPEPFRVDIGDVIPQNFLMSYDLEAASGYDALLPKRMGELIMMITSNSLAEQIARVQFIGQRESPLFPLFNTKFVLAKKTDEVARFSPDGKTEKYSNDPRFKNVYTDKTVSVFADTEVYKRAYFVTDYLIVQNKDDFFNLVKKKTDFSKIITVEEDPKYIPGQSANTKITWLEYSPNKMQLEIKTDQKGFVFIGNNYFKGWQALLDGKRSKIYRVDYSFQGILMEKGDHILELEYRPNIFYSALMLSIFSFAVWLFMLVIFFNKYYGQKTSK